MFRNAMYRSRSMYGGDLYDFWGVHRMSGGDIWDWTWLRKSILSYMESR